MNHINFALCMIVMFAMCHIQAHPHHERNEVAEERKCKDLCKLCNCIGFYCGDECICECNNNDVKNVNCVEEIHNNCIKSNIPFEVLIQGPTGNRIVRNLLTEDSPALQTSNPKKRSTITIYSVQPGESKTIESAPIAVADSQASTASDVMESEITNQEGTTTKPKDTIGEDGKAMFDEKTKRDVENKDSAEPTKDDEKIKDETTDKVTESETESIKDDETDEKPKNDENENSEAKKLQKRQADGSEIQEAADKAATDAAAAAAAAATAEIATDADAKTDEKSDADQNVGLAPILPIGLKLLPLQLGALDLKAFKTHLALQKDLLFNTKFAPLRAKLNALKAKTALGLGLLPIL